SSKPRRQLPSFPTRRSSDLPDRVGALGAAAGGLVLTGVHDLEVVDVAVRLVEVAVAVVVVAVPLVVLGQLLLDLGVGHAGRLLRSEEHTSELQSRENLLFRL